MKFGLKDKVIAQINSIFKKYTEVGSAILYGSRAKGNFEKGSDIDLTLKGDNLELSIIFEIEQDLEELYLPYSFDISIYNHIDNKNLLEHIGRVGILFYEKE